MERACKNCRFCIYALSMRGKEEPYCERHSKWIGDTRLCSEWEMVSVPKPQTNYDRLIANTLEEMAKFLTALSDPKWHIDGNVFDMTAPTESSWLQWLKSPVEVDK